MIESPVAMSDRLGERPPRCIVSVPRSLEDRAVPSKPGRGVSRGTDATADTLELEDLSSRSGSSSFEANPSDPLLDSSQDAAARADAEDKAVMRRCDESFSDFLELLDQPGARDKQRPAVTAASAAEAADFADDAADSATDAAAGTSIEAAEARGSVDPLAVAAACRVDGDFPRYEEATQFHRRVVRDSICVQMHRDETDDEVGEAKPRVADFLVPHHSVHIEAPEANGPAHEKCASDGGAPPAPCLHPAPAEASAPEPEETAPEPGDDPRPSSAREAEGGVPDPEEKLQEPGDASRPPDPSGRRVSFGTVVVRDYAMILGDHPCCSYGPPLTIDWDYLEYEPLPVNEYEFHQPPRRCLREMGLNYYQRRALLAGAGYTEDDFKAVKKAVNKVKLGRSITRQVATTYPLLKAETAVESACRKFKRLIREDHWKQERPMYKKSMAV